MNLIEAIINNLVDTDMQLSASLLKTKVLASRIKNEELLKWVNSELNGYEFERALPEYREEYGVLMGTYLQNRVQVSNTQIPIPNIGKEFSDLFTRIENRDSVTAIASFLGKDVKFSISNNRKAYLENEIRMLGNPNFQILNIYVQIPASFFPNILSNVRSRLLEFMLQVERSFGIEVDIVTLEKNNQVINHIMNTTINNSGDGAIINNGNQNEIITNISITKGDKKSLRSALLTKKIEPKDVDNLLEIVDESVPTSKDKFGESVNNWIKKMLGKAVDGSWQISIGAAGNLLAQTLQNYYGL